MTHQAATHPAFTKQTHWPLNWASENLLGAMDQPPYLRDCGFLLATPLHRALPYGWVTDGDVYDILPPDAKALLLSMPQADEVALGVLEDVGGTIVLYPFIVPKNKLVPNMVRSAYRMC